jgi:hypothetical protein
MDKRELESRKKILGGSVVAIMNFLGALAIYPFVLVLKAMQYPIDNPNAGFEAFGIFLASPILIMVLFVTGGILSLMLLTDLVFVISVLIKKFKQNKF